MLNQSGILKRILALIMLSLMTHVTFADGQAPVADVFATPTTGIAPLTVTLDGSGSYDPDSKIVDYQWSTSDGQTTSGVKTTLTFKVAGHYDINLVVTDDFGLVSTNTAQQTISVTAKPSPQFPIAQFTATPTAGTAPLTVQLDASKSSDSDGEIVEYQWKSSDGQTASGRDATMTFESVGSYDVSLVVKDNDGLISTNSAQQTISVTDKPSPQFPIAQFTATPTAGTAPLTVQLDASDSSDPDGDIVEYQWKSSDGQTASGREVTMTFDAVGNYQISLAAKDNDGLTSSITVSVVVQRSACATPPPNMVAWWPLDETSSLTALDIAGGNHGTYTGSVGHPIGMVDHAVSLDGESGYVNVPHDPALNFGTGDFSIDAWIFHKPDNSSGVQVIVDKRVSDTSGTTGYSFYLYNGKLGFQLADGDGSNICETYPFPDSDASCTNYIVEGPSLADGDWHHVAVTVKWNNPLGGRFYIDGEQQGSWIVDGDPQSNFDTSWRNGSLDNDSPLRIGSRSFSVTGLYQGGIDEVELFNRALSETEIQDIYNAGSAGKCKVDVWISDGIYDTGAEPSPNPPGDICSGWWCSQDIVVTHNNNAPTGLGESLHTHQNPEFGRTNYAYALVRNRGETTAYNVGVEIYRTISTTAGPWSSSWTLLGTSTIPALPPSQTYVIEPVAWEPPGSGHYCMVARLVTLQDPMTVPEMSYIGYNTQQNNNIAWRNLHIVDLLPNEAVGVDFAVGQVSNTTVPTQLMLRVTNENGKPIALSPKVTKVTLGGLEKLRLDDSANGFNLQKTDDGRLLAEMTAETASIGINMTQGEEHTLSLTFAPTALTQNALSDQFYLHVEQIEDQETVGGVSYELRLPMPSPTPIAKFTAKPTSGTAPLTVQLDASDSSDPDGTVVEYQWSSSDGQTASGRETTMTFEVAGTYEINLVVKDNEGLVSPNTAISVTVKPSQLSEIQFDGIKKSYDVGDTLTITVAESSESSRSERVDLWIAVQLPTGELMYITSSPSEQLSLEPKPFKAGINPSDKLHSVFEFEVPPGMAGKYLLYALYAQAGSNPLAADATVWQSNLMTFPIWLAHCLPATYTPSSGLLHLPTIKIASEPVQAFEANLQLDSLPPVFQLIDAIPLTGKAATRTECPIFTPSTGQLHIPTVIITEGSETFEVDLQLKSPEPLIFNIINVTPSP